MFFFWGGVVYFLFIYLFIYLFFLVFLRCLEVCVLTNQYFTCIHYQRYLLRGEKFKHRHHSIAQSRITILMHKVMNIDKCFLIICIHFVHQSLSSEYVRLNMCMIDRGKCLCMNLIMSLHAFMHLSDW